MYSGGNDWMDGMPQGWLQTPPFGNLIDDTFFPMKCPLDQQEVPAEATFSPQFLKDRIIKDMKINIGLIINLTYTTRYYDETSLQTIEYKQIPCRGHNQTPQTKEREDFVRTCNSFLAKNPHKKIAVHCTHGFNRTGFLICFFLCRERDWGIDAAITTFSSNRPPGIYKQEYINELFQIFGDLDDPIMDAPPKPIWENVMPADGGSSHNNNQLEFYEGITDVFLVRDQALRNRIYKHCCMLCDFAVDSSHVIFPGAQPVSMDLQNIGLLKANKYRVSWKADGCRYMMYIQDEENIFFLTRSLQLWRVNNLKFPRKDDLNSHLTDTLIDGEMVTDIINNHKIPKYLIYDVISLNGEIVANQDFDKRCGLIKLVIVEARRRARHNNIIPTEGEPFKVGDKGFFYLQDSKRTWDLKVTHEKDGLIFQPVADRYMGGTCPNILKWKPPSHNSIDFRLVVRDVTQNGCLPETYCYLHVSNRDQAIFGFKLNRAEKSEYSQYNNKIVEMTLKDKRWVVMRERTDKNKANSYETAHATYRSIKDPVTEKILFDFIARIPAEQKIRQ